MGIIDNVLGIFELAEDFNKKIEKKALAKPYNMNVIDELHINENAHSRILHKLLQFCAPDGKYELLQSLIDYIKTSKNKFADLDIEKITNPKITQNKNYIDLWVRDENYAIIFENKVYNAKDQEGQLSCYIKETLNCGYELSQIYVAYLPSVAGNEPEEQSWGGYKDEFEKSGRYVNLSFREDIRTWLKNDVLPNIRVKDSLLRSAVEQYLDYLDGLFLQRENDKTMNEEAKKILDKLLGINDDISLDEKIKVITAKLQEVNSLHQNMLNYKQDLVAKIAFKQHESLKDSIMKILEDYPTLELEYFNGDEAVGVSTNYGRYGGVKLEVDGIKSMLYIAFDNSVVGWHCQLITADGNSYDLNAKEISKIREILPMKDSKNDKIWKYSSSVEDCYQDFLAVLKAINEQK